MNLLMLFFERLRVSRAGRTEMPLQLLRRLPDRSKMVIPESLDINCRGNDRESVVNSFSGFLIYSNAGNIQSSEVLCTKPVC